MSSTLLPAAAVLGILGHAQQAWGQHQQRHLLHKLPTLGWVWHTDQYGNQYNESDVLRQAHALVSTGLARKGWDLVVVEDCWSMCSQLTASGLNCAVPAPRGADGRIRPDHSRFPSGIAGIAEQVHSLGLRMGIYTSMGNYTCAGYTGSWPVQPQTRAPLCAARTLNNIGGITPRYHCAKRTFKRADSEPRQERKEGLQPAQIVLAGGTRPPIPPPSRSGASIG